MQSLITAGDKPQPTICNGNFVSLQYSQNNVGEQSELQMISIEYKSR